MDPKNSPKPVETVYVGALVPRDLYEEFKAIAQAHERPVAGEFRVAIREHIAAYPDKNAA